MAQMRADVVKTEVDVDRQLTVDGIAELCSERDLGKPAVVSEHLDDSRPSLSPLSSLVRRVTGIVVNLSIDLIVGGDVT